MKREHSYITALAILNCVLLWSVFSNYKIVRKEPLKEIIIEKRIDTIVDTKKVVKLEKKIKWYRKQLKVEARENDSLSAEHIRKDGLLGDTSSFIRIEFTEPFSYLMNTKSKFQTIRDEHNNEWLNLPHRESEDELFEPK